MTSEGEDGKSVFGAGDHAAIDYRTLLDKWSGYAPFHSGCRVPRQGAVLSIESRLWPLRFALRIVFMSFRS
jgi:hypothetical protein